MNKRCQAIRGGVSCAGTMKMVKRFRDACWSTGRSVMLPKDGTSIKEEWRCDQCNLLSVTCYLDDFEPYPPYPPDPLRALREVLKEARVKWSSDISKETLLRHQEYIAQIAELELSKHPKKSWWPFGRKGS